MIQKKKSWCIIILFSTLLFIACASANKNAKIIISLGTFKEVALDSNVEWTYLKMIKIYPSKLNCSVNERYANLYICERLKNKDTIYVFEECEKIASFVLDTKPDHMPIIDKNDVVYQHSNKVTVFVKPDFKMPVNAKYLFARISNLTEY